MQALPAHITPVANEWYPNSDIPELAFLYPNSDIPELAVIKLNVNLQIFHWKWNHLGGGDLNCYMHIKRIRIYKS